MNFLIGMKIKFLILTEVLITFLSINKVFIIVAGLCWGFSACGENTQKKESPIREEKRATVFSLPDIPLTIVGAEAKHNYLLSHYWDHFDFSDTLLISKPEITEQIFVDFIHLAQQSKQACVGINAMLDASRKNDLFFVHMCDLLETYLYDPNSPMRNEELYIPVLKYIINSEGVDDSDKIRPIYQLNMLMKNRRGDIAMDFAYTLKNGKTGQMSKLKSEFTILFFNDPECLDCQRVKTYIEDSKVFTQAILDGKNTTTGARLIVLGIYPGSDVAGWQATNYPVFMLNSYDASQTIMNEELYDLKAFPTLYLLDTDKRVLLKDVSVEEIERWIDVNI